MARQITVSFAADASKLNKALGDVEARTKTFGEKVSGVGKGLTVGLTMPLLAGLGMATKAAAEDEAAAAKLALTLKNTVGATDEHIAKVEEQLGAMMKVSTFSDDELRPAMAALVSETRSVEEAQKLLTTAMDLAAAKGIPLEAAAKMLINAHNGQTRELKALGVETKNAEGTAVSFEAVMKDVNAVVGGQAQEALGTTAGKSAALKRDLGEMAEDIGTKVLPIVEKLAGLASDLLGGFTALPEPIQNLGLGLIVFAAASGPVMQAVGAFGKLKTAMLAINTTAQTGFLAKLITVAGPLATGYAALEGGKAAVDKENKGLVDDLLRGLGSILSPQGRAGGGPVTAGVPYMVGERGPELFTPSASGAISPNGAGGTTVVQLFIDGRKIQESLLRLQRTSGSLGLVPG